MAISVRHRSGDVESVLYKHFGDAAVALELTAQAEDIMVTRDGRMLRHSISRVSSQSRTRVSFQLTFEQDMVIDVRNWNITNISALFY
jgi:hypothetical protein